MYHSSALDWTISLTSCRSGIGPASHLEEHGIRVVRDMAGVGSELAGYSQDSHSMKVYSR